MTVQCCVCDKVREVDGEWSSRSLNAMEKNVSHTYCPKCHAKAKASLKREREVFANVRTASAVA